MARTLNVIAICSILFLSCAREQQRAPVPEQEQQQNAKETPSSPPAPTPDSEEQPLKEAVLQVTPTPEPVALATVDANKGEPEPAREPLPRMQTIEWVVVDIPNRLVHRPACPDVNATMNNVRLDAMRAQRIPEHEACLQLPTRKEVRPFVERQSITLPTGSSRSPTPSPRSTTEVPESTAEKTERVNADADVRSHCLGQWPGDFRMQKYCMETGQAAKTKVAQIDAWNQGIPVSDVRAIISDCKSSWGADWRMVDYCTGEQIKAARAVK